MTTTAIEVKDLRKTYPRSLKSAPFDALKGISFDVERGEAFGFIGPNGAGKSTAIKILTGAMSPSAGFACLFGRAITDAQARRGLGYVPENPSLPDYLSPMEILGMGLALHRLSLPNPKDHCMGWLARFGLADVAYKVVRGFSKGMAQRTVLAHALAVQPKLLILDEPLSGLDPIGRRDVVDILSEYKRNGGTIFFTSHVLHDVERLADRFGLIHQGTLRSVQSPAELAGGEETVELRSIGRAPVLNMHEEFSGRWFGVVSRAELWSQLEAIKVAGHVLIEVKPTLSLERAFISVVEKA
jgi:ABC-2 type transport system ATP-binding protein